MREIHSIFRIFYMFVGIVLITLFSVIPIWIVGSVSFLIGIIFENLFKVCKIILDNFNNYFKGLKF